VPVRLVDRNTGALIEPLTAGMITAKIGQTSLPISGWTSMRANRVVVLIDESGSMSENGYSPSSSDHRQALRTIKQVLRDVMAALPPGVSVEYGLFSDKQVISDTFVFAPDEVRNSIDDVSVRFGRRGYGQTAIFDALHEAVKHFGTPQTGDTILLLTDGVDNKSKLPAKMLEGEFRGAHARLLTMMLSESHGAPEEDASRDALRDLVEKTGGSSLGVDGENPAWAEKKESPRLLDTLRRFWNEWVLTTDAIQVRVPGSFAKEVKLTLSVNRQADGRLKHAVAIYPNRLGPCAVATASAH